MIRLDSTTRKLQAVISSAVTTTSPSTVVCFYDQNKEGAETKGAVQLSSVSTVDVDICAAPQQGFVRCIDNIQIYNSDTANMIVSVKIDDSGVDTLLMKQTLSPSQTLFFEAQGGWLKLG